MNDQDRSGDSIRGRIGDVSGQAAIGKDITQTYTSTTGRAAVTEADLAALHQALAALKAQIVAEVPPAQQARALERADELAAAVTAKQPDLPTMEYVKGWFGKHLPRLAGAVTSIVIHPVVGKLVEAAGDGLASEFRRRFGGEPAP
jgi:hypothetical protein